MGTIRSKATNSLKLFELAKDGSVLAAIWIDKTRFGRVPARAPKNTPPDDDEVDVSNEPDPNSPPPPNYTRLRNLS